MNELITSVKRKIDENYHFCSKEGINMSKDKRKSIIPDNTVELSFNNFKNNVDPVLEWIEKYSK